MYLSFADSDILKEWNKAQPPMAALFDFSRKSFVFNIKVYKSFICNIRSYKSFVFNIGISKKRFRGGNEMRASIGFDAALGRYIWQKDVKAARSSKST